MMNQDLIQELIYLGIDIDTDTSVLTVELNNSGLNGCRFAVSTIQNPSFLSLSLSVTKIIYPPESTV